MIERYPLNPIIRKTDVKPSRPDFEVMAVFNAGATSCQGRSMLLLRVAERPIPQKGYVATAVLDLQHPGTYRVLRIRQDDPDLEQSDPRVFSYRGQIYLTSISHLRRAVSDDGRRFEIAPLPTIVPEYPWEEYGIEDPRIIFMEGDYYITYSAISSLGVSTAIARTRDFQMFEKLGIIFAPDNKDIALFPEKIGGRYWCFHRPSQKHLGSPSMWLASSDNLLDWGHHHFLIGPRPGMWDAERVGCGAQPIRTAAGWLQIYHGADHRTRYCSGALLLDLEKPWRVLARSCAPLLEPQASYEISGFMPNVIFHNGLIERPGGKADLYYGAADESTCVATIDIAETLAWLQENSKK